MAAWGSPIMGFTSGRLRQVGLWPGDGDSRLYAARSLLATANVYAVAALLTGVFFEEAPSRGALVENTGNVLTVAPCCVAAVRLWWHGPAFRVAVARLRSAMSGAEEEADLVRATAAEERGIARTYTAVVCGTGLCYFARPLADLAAGRRDPALPFNMWPVLPRGGPARFAAEYAVQLVCVLACVLTMAAVDSFTFALVKYSALQFRVLGASLSALQTRFPGACFAERLQRRLREHQDMLANTQNIADLLSPLLFTHYIVSSAAICLVGYRMSATSQLSELLISIGQLTCIVYRLFVLSYFSSEVMHQSLAVNDAAYSCRWYLVDKRAKMMLALLISRAQNPAVMRTGKFGVLSLEIFFKLVQGAYSYYALLKKLSST